MKKYSLKTLSLALVLTSSVITMPLAAQDTKEDKSKASATAAKSKVPQSFEQFLKPDMKKSEGIIPIYYNDSKYYLELKDEYLGSRFLISGAIVEGPWAGTLSDVTDMFTFSKGENHTVRVMKEIVSDRVNEDSPLADAIEASNMQPELFSIPIVAYSKDKKGCIIDITADVTTTGKLFVFPNLQWVNRPVANRSEVDTVQVISQGVKFMKMHSQSDFVPPGVIVSYRNGGDKPSTVILEWAIQLLPKLDMPMRLADSRVGSNTITYNDYSKDLHTVRKTTITKRWNLKVKSSDMDRYRNGELVEPLNPIYIYVYGKINDIGREALQEAVAEWNMAFESAGFKNALQIKTSQPDAIFTYHSIVFIGRESGFNHNTVSDPLTGELITGYCLVEGTNSMQNSLRYAKCLLGGCEPRFFSELERMLIKESYRYNMSNRLGQILGLRPNVGASIAYTTKQLRDNDFLSKNSISTSVTDDSFINYVAQREDNIAPENLFSRVSHYDRWAIEYLYRTLPDAKDMYEEKKILSKHLAKVKDNPWLQYTASRSSSYKKGVNLIGSDLVESAKLTLINAKRMIEYANNNTDKIVPKEENEWWSLLDFHRLSGSGFNLSVRLAMAPIGGLEMNPIIAGQNETAISFVPKEVQKASLKFLEENILNGKAGFNRGSFVEKLSATTNLESMVTGYNQIFLGLLNREFLNQLAFAEERIGTKALSMGDLFNMVDRNVFLNYSSVSEVNPYQKRMQYLFVKNLLDVMTKTDIKTTMDPVSFFLLGQYNTMKSKFTGLSKNHSTAEGRMHYKGLLNFITRSVAEQSKQVKSTLPAAGAKGLTFGNSAELEIELALF